MIALAILLGSFGSLFLLWLLWIVISGLSRAHADGRLSPHVIAVGTGIAYIALAWDVLCNVMICTFVFLDVPREATLSQRLRRLLLTTGWRQCLALWFAVDLINPFSADPSDPHIHIPELKGTHE